MITNKLKLFLNPPQRNFCIIHNTSNFKYINRNNEASEVIDSEIIIYQINDCVRRHRQLSFTCIALFLLYCFIPSVMHLVLGEIIAEVLHFF